jgi:predicted membrane protein
MKNKLYDFLDKHKAFINVFGMAAWLYFVINLYANKPVAIAAIAVFMIVFCVDSFLILGATYRSHARALQSLMDKRNSSHPHWDGHVRSHADLEPRLKLLRDRMAQDQAEVDHIEQVMKP